jgi:hypothetical protein
MTRTIRNTVAAIALSLAAGGCIPFVLPIPYPANSPRYAPELTTDLNPGTDTATTVTAKLGPPDISRSNDRIRIYDWTVNGGRWIVGAVGIAGGTVQDAGPITSHHYLMLLRFDDDGVLRSKELAGPANKGANESEPSRGADRYCFDSGLCLEHQLLSQSACPHGCKTDRVITVPATVQPPPIGNACRLIVWAAPGEWSTGVPIRPADPSVSSDRLLDPEQRPADAPASGQAPTYTYAWLPNGTFASFEVGTRRASLQAVLPPYMPAWHLLVAPLLIHDVLAHYERVATIPCEPGTVVYAELGEEKSGHRRNLTLTPLDEAVGRAAVSDMRQVLLPPEIFGQVVDTAEAMRSN